MTGSITSTLTNCTVQGSVFGAGFSASAPTVEVMGKEGFSTEPQYDGNSGTYTQGVYPATTSYTWKHTDAALTNGGNPFEDDGDNHYILTTVDMTGLGTVTGNATLTLNGSTTVEGDVFGGGDQGVVNGSTTVNIEE